MQKSSLRTSLTVPRTGMGFGTAKLTITFGPTFKLLFGLWNKRDHLRVFPCLMS